MADELGLEPAPGVRIAWDLERARAHAAGTEAEAWRLDRDRLGAGDLVRLLTAALADGSLFLLAAHRPADASAHDEERIAAAQLGAGRRRVAEEVLLSTEYGPGGQTRRIGLEATFSDEEFPLRAAGDAVGESGSGDEVRLRFRVDGVEGTAVLATVRGG